VLHDVDAGPGGRDQASQPLDWILCLEFTSPIWVTRTLAIDELCAVGRMYPSLGGPYALAFVFSSLLFSSLLLIGQLAAGRPTTAMLLSDQFEVVLKQ